jgi:class 3 adenylate cyclase
MNTPAEERHAGHGQTHPLLPEDRATMVTAFPRPTPQPGTRWIDPAVEPCLRKLAPFGRFVFYDKSGAGVPRPIPADAALAASGPSGQDADPVLDTIEKFVTGVRAVPSPDRFLGTVLFVDVAESTKLAAEIGDSRFRDLLGGFIQLVRRQVDRYQGQLVNTAGDGALALFDSPARAIGCAQNLRGGARALGLAVRAGAHTGEMEHGPAGEVHGIAVHTGARVAALAGPGEILVSRTIRDLVAGAPIRLESRGTHELKGVPGTWEVFAVTD